MLNVPFTRETHIHIHFPLERITRRRLWLDSKISLVQRRTFFNIITNFNKFHSVVDVIPDVITSRSVSEQMGRISGCAFMVAHLRRATWCRSDGRSWKVGLTEPLLSLASAHSILALSPSINLVLERRACSSPIKRLSIKTIPVWCLSLNFHTRSVGLSTCNARGDNTPFAYLLHVLIRINIEWGCIG